MVVLRNGMCPGLTEELVQALRAADITTAEDLVSSNTEQVAQMCSVSYKTLVAVRRVVLAQHTAFPVLGASLYEELLSSTAILSTGNPSLDKLLDSGLYTGELTELAGCPGSGKTQVCFGVAVNIAYQLKQKVIFIDSTGGFCANSLLQIIQAKTSSMEEQMESLQRIHIFQVFDVFSLLSCLHNIRTCEIQKASVGSSSVKAVIVDSVSAILSHIIGGKQNEGMSLMMQVAGVLKTTAKDFNISVLVSNYEVRDGNKILKAGLGQSWSHIPQTRIHLERVQKLSSTNSSLRTATLTKSSRQSCQLKVEFDLLFWRVEDRCPNLSLKRKLEK